MDFMEDTQQKIAGHISGKLLELLKKEIEMVNEFQLNTIEQPVFVERIINLTAKKYRKRYFGFNHYLAKWNAALVVSIIAIIISIISICYKAMS
jgi:hypothetical protein